MVEIIVDMSPPGNVAIGVVIPEDEAPDFGEYKMDLALVAGRIASEVRAGLHLAIQECLPEDVVLEAKTAFSLFACPPEKEERPDYFG